MRVYIIMTLFALLMFHPVKGQQLEFGEETWVKITNEVKQLELIDKKIQNELDSLLFRTKQDSLLGVFAEYKYFHLYISGDTNCQELEFRLSNYPRKSKELIGFFILREYFVFVYNELPDFLKQTGCKRKFSYMEHKLGNLVISEDDTPCWIIEYKKSQFYLLHYPAK